MMHPLRACTAPVGVPLEAESEPVLVDETLRTLPDAEVGVGEKVVLCLSKVVHTSAVLTSR